MYVFTKMQGLGNDFMVITGAPEALKITPELIQQWSNRHTGIGFDQLLLIAPDTTQQTDAQYFIYNADGQAVEQCGNGARCLARYAYDTGLVKTRTMRLQAPTSQVTATLCDDGLVSVEMGNYEVTPATYKPHQYRIDNDAIITTFIQLANPHLIIFVEDITHAPLARWGEYFNQHPDFKAGVNVEICQITSSNTLKLRVYERGVGETQACGTGACATMIAAMQQGYVEASTTVSLPGGDLTLDWPGSPGMMTMTGEAITVFKGKINPLEKS